MGGQPVNKRIHHGRRVYNQGCDHFIFIATKSLERGRLLFDEKEKLSQRSTGFELSEERSVISLEIYAVTQFTF